MREFLRKTKAFSIPFFILVGLSSMLLLFFDKVEIAMWINGRNGPVPDIFFRYFTHLGDGVAAVIISLVVMVVDVKRGVIVLASYLLSGLIIQILKINVFPDIFRPIAYVTNTSAIHLVDGVRIWAIQSFPSGHSGTVFATFFCVAAYARNYRIQLLALLISILVAYSRLYLFQHFLPDVICGAVIGTFTSLVLLAFFDNDLLINRLNIYYNHRIRPFLRKMIDNPWLIRVFIVLFASFLFVPFIGNLHLFDWDEINFAESAREMLVSHNYLTVQIDFKPFWEKPPLFIWFQVLSMKIFGINEFAARFPNAVCGILTLLSLFSHGKKLFDAKFGLIWVITYSCSILPFLYFKSGIIDPWFNLFIFNGFAFFIYYVHALKEESASANQIKLLLLSASLIGLAVLTKGPVAFLVFTISLSVFLAVIRFRMPIKLLHVLLYLVCFSLVGGFWFIVQWMNGHGALVAEFINYQIRLFTTQDAGHGGFFLYHFVVLLMGVFPASVFALPFLFKLLPANTLQVLFQRWMIILFWTVLLLFTIVKTKIVHYSSLCYFPITFLAALYLYSVEVNALPIKKWVVKLQLVTGGIIALAAIALPIAAKNIRTILEQGWVEDDFTAGNMMASVHWTGLESMAGVALAVGLVYYGCCAEKKRGLAPRILMFSSLLCIVLLTLQVTPRIEGYSQRANIEFFKGTVGKNAYVNALGYFSYAPYFYAQKQPGENPKAGEMEWLLSGDIDKDAYFSVKIDKLESNLKKYPTLQILYAKNGFVFLKRKAILHDK